MKPSASLDLLLDVCRYLGLSTSFTFAYIHTYTYLRIYLYVDATIYGLMDSCGCFFGEPDKQLRSHWLNCWLRTQGRLSPRAAMGMVHMGDINPHSPMICHLPILECSAELSTLHLSSSPRAVNTALMEVTMSYQHQMSHHLTSGHTTKAITLVTRFALACEGAWSVVAEGIGVAPAWLAFIHICKTAQGQ